MKCWDYRVLRKEDRLAKHDRRTSRRQPSLLEAEQPESGAGACLPRCRRRMNALVEGSC